MAVVNESIYSLIPPEPVHVARPPMHRSKFQSSSAGRSQSPNHVVVPPSYSTFPAKHDPGQRDCTGAMAYAGRSGVMGKVVAETIDPHQFLKSKRTGSPTLPPVGGRSGAGAGGSPTGGAYAQGGASSNGTKGANAGGAAGGYGGGASADGYHGAAEVTPGHSVYSDPERRPPVPKASDKPVMGLMTEKDFVKANAIDVICSAPKKVPIVQPRAVDRPDFAKVPEYLSSVKSQVQQEKEYTESLKASRAAGMDERQASMQSMFSRQLPEAERVRLLEKLRGVYAEKHRVFQSLPFSRAKDINFIVKKEAMEKELREIDAAIEKLNKQVVVIYVDDVKKDKAYTRAAAVMHAQTICAKCTA